jgi:amino acid transporter
MANNGAYQNERLGRVDEEDKLQGGSSITEKTRTRSQGRNELRYELSTSPWPEEH